MPNTLSDRDWEILLRRIQDGKCTPFLGAGVNAGILPLGSEIAQDWAREFSYPLDDSSDLARVAQFLAVTFGDKMFPKDEIRKRFEKEAGPNCPVPKELSVLADLPLPIYMTTNYDNLMVRALEERHKDPKQELCRWNTLIKGHPSVFDSQAGFRPTPANPVVFHLHGYRELSESLVLTEDDYLDFLVNISRDQNLLPPRIQEALAGASLLFLGYRLADWDFRVIFRGLVTATEASLRRISVAVQLSPEAPEGEQKSMQDYLTRYFGDINVRVYWGTAAEFIAELGERWRSFQK